MFFVQNSFGLSTSSPTQIDDWRNEALPDTVRLNALQELIRFKYLPDSPDSAIFFARSQYQFSKKKELFRYTSMALNSLGSAYFSKSEYDTSLDYYHRSFKFRKQQKDWLGMTNDLSTIGDVHKRLGNYEEAIDFYEQGLVLAEKEGYKERARAALISLGNVYNERDDYNKAIEFYVRSLKINEELNDEASKGTILMNMANVYLKFGDNASAKELYLESLTILKKNRNIGLMQCLSNMGSLYLLSEDFEAAEEFYIKSLELAKELDHSASIASALNNVAALKLTAGDAETAVLYFLQSYNKQVSSGYMEPMAGTLGGLGQGYLELGNTSSKIGEKKVANELYAKSKDYFQNSYYLAETQGRKNELSLSCKGLYEVHKVLGNTKESLEMFEQFFKLNSELKDINAQRGVIKERFNYQYEKKQVIDSLSFVQEKKVQRVQHKLEKTYILFGSICLMALIFIFFRNRLKRMNKERSSLIGELETLKSKNVVLIKENLSKSLIPVPTVEILNREKIEKGIEAKLNQTDWLILTILFEKPLTTNNELSEQVHLSVHGVRSSLKKMYRLFSVSGAMRDQRVFLIVEAARLSSVEVVS